MTSVKIGSIKTFLIKNNIMAEKWMQKANEEMERKGTKGTLRKALGVKEGEDIPCAKALAAWKNRPELKEKLTFYFNTPDAACKPKGWGKKNK